MATYIVLGKFTDQGIRGVKDTNKRAEAFKAMAKKAGVTVKDLYWTLGQFDVMTVVDAPDDATLTALLLSAGALGTLHTQSARPTNRMKPIERNTEVAGQRRHLLPVYPVRVRPVFCGAVSAGSRRTRV